MLLSIRSLLFVFFVIIVNDRIYSTCIPITDTFAVADDPTLQGYLTIGSERYEAVCRCNNGFQNAAGKASQEALQCNPTKLIIMEDHGNKGLSQDVVRKLYGQPRDIILADIDTQMFMCMDDRIAEPSMMTPGGDLGEFALAMFVLSTFTNGFRTLELHDIKSLLEKYIDTRPHGRRMYHCNDEESIARIEKSLGILDLDITQPQLSLYNSVLNELTHARNHGDIHLRSLLQSPEKYHISNDIVVNAVKAYYTTLWDIGSDRHHRLVLDVLLGTRAPKAFLEVDEGNSCFHARKTFLTQPKKTRAGITANVLMIHTRAAAQRRHETAAFILEVLKSMSIPIANISEEDIYARMEKYGLEWLEATVGVAASDLKFYKITLQ